MWPLRMEGLPAGEIDLALQFRDAPLAGVDALAKRDIGSFEVSKMLLGGLGPPVEGAQKLRFGVVQRLHEPVLQFHEPVLEPVLQVEQVLLGCRLISVFHPKHYTRGGGGTC